MDSCNGTATSHSALTIVTAYDCVAAVASVLTIICVSWTPSLGGLTGYLIINDQSACLISQVLSMFIDLTRGHVSTFARAIASTLLTSTNMASSVFLTLLNLNMYMAVCRPATYKSKVTRLRARIVTMVTWLLTSVACPLTLLNENFYVVDCSNDMMMIFYNRHALWIPALLLVFFLLLPLICNFLCLWSVAKASASIPPNLTLRQAYLRGVSFKKVKFIYVNTILYTVFVLPMFVVCNVSQFFHGDDAVWKTVLMVLWALTKINQNLRLVVYFCCYSPIRKAAKVKLLSLGSNKTWPHQTTGHQSSRLHGSGTKLQTQRPIFVTKNSLEMQIHNQKNTESVMERAETSYRQTLRPSVSWKMAVKKLQARDN